jgi:hypothetical protein
VQRLQHHDLQLQDRVIGLAAGVALALLRLRLRHGLDVSAEILHGTIFLIVSSGSPLALIASSLRSTSKKPLLPHDSLAPSANDRVRSPSQIRGGLGERNFSRCPLLIANHL